MNINKDTDNTQNKTNPIEFDKYLAYSNLSKYASFPSINFQNIDPKKYRQAIELLNYLLFHFITFPEV